MTTVSWRDPVTRERDVRVAEEVLGWRINREHGYGEYFNGTFKRDELTKVGHPPTRCRGCDEHDPCRKQHSVPRFAADPAATLSLLDRMVEWSHKHGWEPFITAEVSGMWKVTFMRGCARFGLTFADAVCEAALAAAGGEG